MYLRKSDGKMKKLLRKMKGLKILIPIVGISIANLQLWDFIKMANMINIKSIIFDIIINFVIIYLCVENYKQRKEIKSINEYVVILTERNSTLMELNDHIRCFKHDFYNIMQAIDGYIMMDDMQALKQYFSKLLEECDHMKNLEMLTTNAINNPAVYGVLLNKYKLAENKNIKMNIDVLMDFSNIGEKSYKLSRVLGILLDNAIEASLECEEKYISVSFSQINNDTVKKIVIENTYKEKSVDTNAIFEKEFSSKKAKGNSGLGLWKARDMLSKDSKMWLQTSKDAKYFKQELEIYV